MYQSLVNLPEIDSLIDYRFKALALQIRSKAVLAIGKPLESAELHMQISRFLRTDEERNHLFVWQALNRITENGILRALAEQQTMEVRGWLELNLIARRSDMLPAKMEPWVERWFELYGETPRRFIYSQTARRQPAHIHSTDAHCPDAAILGTSAKSIGGHSKRISVCLLRRSGKNGAANIIDISDDPAEFNLQYLQAVERGADFIVGPLDKELVDLLQERRTARANSDPELRHQQPDNG